MAEVRVSDEEYQILTEAYRQYKDYVEGSIDIYCKYVGDAAASGLKAGAAHDALMQFMGCATAMKGQVRGILDPVIALCNDYIAEVDNLDKDVY